MAYSSGPDNVKEIIKLLIFYVILRKTRRRGAQNGQAISQELAPVRAHTFNSKKYRDVANEKESGFSRQMM